ncbi:MAG: aldose epimerase family protein [Victivallaceae bacterium]
MNKQQGEVSREPFFKTADGREITLFTLDNGNGASVSIIDYGATVIALQVPDRNGKSRDVVLGYANPADYLANPACFGGVIGRYANRISNARFVLDGKTYNLTKNIKEGNALHGGKGFDKAFWQAYPVENSPEPALRLKYVSRDGEEGFPGKVTAEVLYSLTKDNALRIDYTAVTDRTTVINLTNHSYFNLNGESAGTIDNHELWLGADFYTPVQNKQVTGEILSVKRNPELNFTVPATIASKLAKEPDGYDHNYVLNRRDDPETAAVAQLHSAESGVMMEVFTSEPGIQVYSANFLDDSVPDGKNGKRYPKRAAVCLETQHFPNSPNVPQFPSTVLRTGELFQSFTVYRFSVIS